jgi:hypothetical protein
MIVRRNLGIKGAKPCQDYHFQGYASLGLGDLEGLQLEVDVRDVCD